MDATPPELPSSPDIEPCQDEAFCAPPVINHARSRPLRVPRPQSGSYPHFKACQTGALRTAVNHLTRELGARSGVAHLTLHAHRLTLEPHSQSKLSQQELSDLQKATHFDKKELQQWYKGEFLLQSETSKRAC